MLAVIISSLFLLVYLSVNLVQPASGELTPQGTSCLTIAQNALLLLDSGCFEREADTFDGVGTVKKADFLDYVCLLSGIESPLNPGLSFPDNINALYHLTVSNDWVPVTGAVARGDIMVDNENKQIHVVSYPQSFTICSDGYKLSWTDPLYETLLHSLPSNWGNGCDEIEPNFMVDPSNPPPYCSRWELDPWVVVLASGDQLDALGRSYAMQNTTTEGKVDSDIVFLGTNSPVRFWRYIGEATPLTGYPSWIPPIDPTTTTTTMTTTERESTTTTAAVGPPGPGQAGGGAAGPVGGPAAGGPTGDAGGPTGGAGGPTGGAGGPTGGAGGPTGGGGGGAGGGGGPP